MPPKPSTPASTPQTSKPVTLDDPIPRGEQTIDTVTLRKPRAGELRGVSLLELAQLDVAALQTVLPRISTPTLTTADVAAMSPADLLVVGAELAGFFQRKADKLGSPSE